MAYNDPNQINKDKLNSRQTHMWILHNPRTILEYSMP